MKRQVLCASILCFVTALSNFNWVISTGVVREAFDGQGQMDPAMMIDPEPQEDRRLQYQSWSPPSCNLTLYTQWKSSPYDGVLINDPSFWRYQTQLQFVLSKGLALELAVAKCANRFKLLQNFKAGKGGPVDIQNVWKAMCKDECLQSDIMHQDAMDSTGCDCLQLSTQESELSYRVPGDWCSHNSARMLCDMLGFCGIWECRIGDFMCPRYEWNKRMIPLKGPGHCDRDAAASTTYKFVGPLVAAVVVISSVLMAHI